MAVTTNPSVNGPTGNSDSVPGAGILVATSRAAATSDNGNTLELAASVTYTLSGAVALPAGIAILGPASGTATIACTAGATVDGASSNLTVGAGEAFALVPRTSNAAAFVRGL